MKRIKKPLTKKKSVFSKQTQKRLLKTWDKKFKQAIRAGHKPEGDLFEGLMNDFDKTEW